MKTAKRFVLLPLMAVILILSACSGNAPEISVNVTISSDYTVTDGTVTLKKTSPTAADAIIEACKANNISYKYQNGMFDSFSGIESTKENGWLLYINGSLSQTGAATAAVADGDKVEFRYVNYDNAFNSPENAYEGKWKSGIGADGSYAFLNIADSEASFTYVSAQNAVTTYSGSYLMANDVLTIDDNASASKITLPFKSEEDKLTIEFDGKSIVLTK